MSSLYKKRIGNNPWLMSNGNKVFFYWNNLHWPRALGFRFPSIMSLFHELCSNFAGEGGMSGHKSWALASLGVTKYALCHFDELAKATWLVKAFTTTISSFEFPLLSDRRRVSVYRHVFYAQTICPWLLVVHRRRSAVVKQSWRYAEPALPNAHIDQYPNSSISSFSVEPSILFSNYVGQWTVL